jgi:hypothetical protein
MEQRKLRKLHAIVSYLGVPSPLDLTVGTPPVFCPQVHVTSGIVCLRTQNCMSYNANWSATGLATQIRFPARSGQEVKRPEREDGSLSQFSAKLSKSGALRLPCVTLEWFHFSASYLKPCDRMIMKNAYNKLGRKRPRAILKYWRSIRFRELRKHTKTCPKVSLLFLF